MRNNEIYVIESQSSTRKGPSPEKVFIKTILISIYFIHIWFSRWPIDDLRDKKP